MELNPGRAGALIRQRSHGSEKLLASNPPNLTETFQQDYIPERCAKGADFRAGKG